MNNFLKINKRKTPDKGTREEKKRKRKDWTPKQKTPPEYLKVKRLKELRDERKAQKGCHFMNISNMMKLAKATTTTECNTPILDLLTYKLSSLSGPNKNLDHFSICACHPCAGAMLIFFVSFQFDQMSPIRWLTRYIFRRFTVK